MYAAYVAGDAERALASFHPDVHVDFTVRADTSVGKGHEALSEIVASWIATWDDYSESIKEIHDFGDRICLIATQRGRGKGSGLEIETAFASVYEIEGGLITSMTMYTSPADAFKAAARAG